MFSRVCVCPRLVVYTTVVCLVVIFQLRNVYRITTENDITYTVKILSDRQSHGEEKMSVLAQPVRESLSDTWRKGLTPEEFNDMFERILNECNADSPSCPKNGNKLILLDWTHFVWTLRGGVQGENIWCGSMMDALHKLGYSMLISIEPDDAYKWYRKYHQNVRLIIREEHDVCVYDSQCVYADVNAVGSLPSPNATHLNIPIWKIFHANWWNYAVEPLGGPFTLSPEPYKIWPSNLPEGRNNYYLGYTVEQTCLKTRFEPFAHRPRQAYILGKYLKYFMDNRYILSDPVGGAQAQLNDDFYLDFSKEEEIMFVAGQVSLRDAGNHASPPRGITQHPKVERTEFQKLISRSRVMVGLGNPVLSPTPYEALCLGIPFINPIYWWDKNDPRNRSSWDGQHGALIYEDIGEPYVYHVRIGDREGLKAALRKAMSTPIKRFIPPRMKSIAVLDRMRTLVETDWRPVAKAQMEALGYQGPQ